MIIPRKSLGQNFLKNKTILQNIVDSLELNPADSLIEIGAGPGHLTSFLLPHVDKLYAVEIDRRFEPDLNMINDKFKNLNLIFGDILSIDLNMFIKIKKITGNLPYNISTPILGRVTYELNPELLVFMFAINTANRFLASPSSRDYSSATIFVSSFYSIEKVVTVKKENFYPIPKVDSMVVKFKMKKDLDKEYLKDFNLFVQRLFFYRRKTILNSLDQNIKSKDISKEILSNSNIDFKRRVETLNIEELNFLFNIYRRLLLIHE